MQGGFKQSVIEGLILASPEPLPTRRIAEVVEGLTPAKVGQVVAELNNRYMQAGSSFRIRELAGGFQFYIVPEYAGYVQELFTRRRKMRLTRASLETLAIVAYRQPVTKAEVEHIRGVASDGVIHNLLDKKLVTIRGRAKTVGKPLQYGTTDQFLKFFGLAGLEDLPKMSEIVEMISAREPDSQTELNLSKAVALHQAAQKLNVADGTYDPQSHNETDEDDGVEPATPTAEPGDATTEITEDTQDTEITDAVEDGSSDDDTEESPGVIVDMDATR